VAFLGKLKDYRAKYKNVEGLNDLINVVENTPTKEEKDEEKRLAGIAIDKVIKGGVDYATLDKKGSYTKSVKIGKEFYDVVVNSDGTATCNGVKREW
jgi:hypothetical protein